MVGHINKGVIDTNSSCCHDAFLGSYRTLEVNLAAAAKATRTAVQHFIKNDKPGLVIHTSSIYGFCGAPLAPLYAASKHGVCFHFIVCVSKLVYSFAIVDLRISEKLWYLISLNQYPS